MPVTKTGVFLPYSIAKPQLMSLLAHYNLISLRQITYDMFQYMTIKAHHKGFAGLKYLFFWVFLGTLFIFGDAADAKKPTLSGDASLFDKAINAAKKNKFSAARAHVKKTNTPLDDRFIEWMFVQKSESGAEFKDIKGFMDRHGYWPRMGIIRAQAELKLYKYSTALKGGKQDDAIARKIAQYCAKYKPQTHAGRIALARVLMTKKNRTTKETKHLKDLVKTFWRGGAGGNTAGAIYAEFKKYISNADTLYRAKQSIYKRDTKRAVADSTFLKGNEKKLIIASMRALKRQKNSPPRSLRKSPVYVYASAYGLYKRKKYKAAAKTLRGIKPDTQETASLKKFWSLRNILARRAMRKDSSISGWAIYDLVKNHGASPRHYGLYLDGEFFAGWIALTRLKQPERAKTHFNNLRKTAKRPISIARGEYWYAQSLERLNDIANAKKHYHLAAIHSTTYYGQLAREKLGLSTQRLPLPATPTATKEAINALNNNELVRVINVLHKAKRKDYYRTFFSTLAFRLKDKNQLAALAELGIKMGRYDLSVRTAKQALFAGRPIGLYAYPKNALPQFKRLNDGVEKAFLYGLSRQESEFYKKAKSRVGARGLMQIMPATGRIIAKQNKVRYSKSKLVNDAVYNVQLGDAHLRDLLMLQDGSYIMTIASYNAGPGRIPQWTKAYGDPRKGDIEPVDFVESIPFSETRNYVMRVLENVQVYRSLFNPKPPSSTLASDLNRGLAAEAQSCSKKTC